ncbi:MAG TPA: ankyrin repeat domain-containing protein [Pyrinomonadaceae bacterium]|jgi:hypothetical protein
MSDCALIEAVKAGEYAKAEALIAGGAEVNEQDEQGWTALNFAAGRGHLALVKLLLKNGADLFKVGEDGRTPYMIALAAGHISVVKYLREVEEASIVERPEQRLPRPYCRAYMLSELKGYSGWDETRADWNEKVVFIHEDFTVTKSMWQNENVIFKSLDAAWKEFCMDSLKFKAPEDLDLIEPRESNG